MSGSTSSGPGPNCEIDVMGHLQTYAVQRTSAKREPSFPYNHHCDKVRRPTARKNCDDVSSSWGLAVRWRGRSRRERKTTVGSNSRGENNEVAGTHNHLRSCFLVGWASLVKCCPVRCLWGWTRKLDFSLPTSVWCKEWSCWIRAIYLTPPSPTCCGVMSVT